MSGAFYEVSPADALTFAFVAVTPVAMAAVDSFLPARRATKVDPIEAPPAE